MTLVPANSRPVNPLANVTSVFARTGAVVAGNADYLAVPSGGLTGAVAATRFVGGTATVAPTTGTFAVGDFVVAQNGTVWVCTVAGSPGTWTQAGGGSQPQTLTSTLTLNRAGGFTASHVFDLGDTPNAIQLTAEMTARDADGETWGETGDDIFVELAAGVGTFAVSDDGVVWASVADAAVPYINHTSSSGHAVLLDVGDYGVQPYFASRYLRVTYAIWATDTFETYAGANDPTASVLATLTYR